MKKEIRTRKRGSIPYLDNEEGMLLVLTMVILLVLTSLAATNIINAYLERSLAKNHHYASLALNAADAGIAHGLSWLVENPPSSTDLANVNWTVADIDGDGDNGKDGGFDVDGDGSDDANFDVTISLMFDEDDMDNDGLTDEDSPPDLVYFNNGSCVDDYVTPGGAGTTEGGCYGFPDSVFDDDADVKTNPPYPVILIRSTGTYGSVTQGAGRRVVDLQVARNGLDVAVYGAVTAFSDIDTGGSVEIDGRGHDVDGNLCTDPGASCSCTTGYPGVTVPCTNGDLNGDGDCLDKIGDPGYAFLQNETDYEIDLHKPEDTYGDPDDTGTLFEYGSPPEPNSPAEVLGMTMEDLVDMIGTPTEGGPPATGTQLYWYYPTAGADFRLQNDHIDQVVAGGGSTTDAFGVVIVHNPNFNPRVWDISIQSGEAGSGYDPTNSDACDGAPCYEPRLDTNDPAFDQDFYDAAAPATLDLNSNDTFKGVVIADLVDKINGTADLIGALVSLSKIKDSATLGNGSAKIYFSCDAIQTFTTQGYTTKIGWHRRF